MNYPFSTGICAITNGCTRRTPSAKLRHVLPTLEPLELRERLMKACEICSRKVVSDYCRENGRVKCNRTSCYRLLTAVDQGKYCLSCKEAQRKRQRDMYLVKKARNHEAETGEIDGFHCTHCSAIIPVEQRRRRPHGRPGWVHKCETCLQRNRESDAKRRAVIVVKG